MRIVARGLALFVCLAIIWLPISADVLILKDGREIHGSHVQIGEQTISIVTDAGVEEYPISQLDHIVREADPPTGTDASSESSTPQVNGTNAAVRPSSSGESHCTPIIEDMAEEKRDERIQSGTISLIAGGVIGGLLVVGGGDIGITLGLISFAIIGLPGALRLGYPSKTERRLEDILMLDADSRERKCAIELEVMAEQAKRSRYLSAISDGALAMIGLAVGWILLPIYWAVQAARTIVLPSAEEEAFERYQRLVGELE